jgi:Ribbon-helix-helix protein, copG family
MGGEWRVERYRRYGHTESVKTTVSIPDDVFARAERLARQTKKSRSQLFSDAVREYVARHAAEEVTDAMDRACDELRGSTDKFVSSAGRRILERSEW